MKAVARVLRAAALLALLGMLLTALAAPVDPPTDLASLVAGRLADSGVAHDVTAVLLNFRGYDTLLELAVLLIAVVGVRGLGGLPTPPRSGRPGPVLRELALALLPLLMLVAVYLLWIGAYAPGGAFQAAAVLAAAGVLALLAGASDWAEGLRRRAPLLLTGGLLVFIAVALAGLVTGGQLLALPQAHAGALILLVESAATVSIAATLLLLFMGASEEEGP